MVTTRSSKRTRERVTYEEEALSDAASEPPLKKPSTNKFRGKAHTKSKAEGQATPGVPAPAKRPRNHPSSEDEFVPDTRILEDDVQETDDALEDDALEDEGPTVISDYGTDVLDERAADLSREGRGSLNKASQHAIYNNRSLGFVQKVETAFELLYVQNRRMPGKVQERTYASLADIFNQPPKGGQQMFRPLKKPDSPYDVVAHAKYKYGQVTAWLLGPNDKKLPFSLYDQSNLNFTNTTANCNRIMALLANFINAWPDAPLDDTKFKWQVVAAAVAVMSPGAVKVKVPVWTQEGWHVFIPYYDTEAQAIKNLQRSMYTGVSLESSFPGVPLSAELWESGKHQQQKIIGKDSNGYHESSLPTDRDFFQDRCFTQGKQQSTTTKDELLAREKFERFLSWKLAGRMATKKEMEGAALAYEELYLAGKRHGGRLSRAHRLVKVWYHSWKKLTYISARKTLTDALARELEGAILPRLFVRSANFAWIKPIVEAVRRRWRETNDPVETWIEAAAITDIANEEIRSGNPPLGGCYCTTDMQKDVTHICEKCGSDVPCVTRTRNVWGLYICQKCLARQKDSNTLSEDVVKVGLLRQMRAEVSLVGRSWNDKKVQEVYEEAFDYLKNQMGDCGPTEWWDLYGSSKREVSNTFNPFFPSIEAIDPFTCRSGPGGTLQTWVHAAPNLGMIPHALNLAKGGSLVSSVAEIGDNCARSVGASPEEKRELDNKLMARFNEQRVIVLKYGIAKKERVSSSFTKDEFQAAKEEFRTGKLSSGNPIDRATMFSRYQRVFGIERTCAWNEEQQADLVGICNEIEEEFQTSIPRSKIDGAPWPFKSDPQPVDWSWDGLWSFVRERHERMKFMCNKYWPTIDSTIGLSCEIFFQNYNGSQEFLGLPISGNIRHPLRLSVAHKVHGEQMRTGWPAAPKSIKDRREDCNNILMETWFSNCVKYDFGDRYKSELQGMVRSINIPLEIYNPNLARPTAPTAKHGLPDKEDFDVSTDMGGRNEFPGDSEDIFAAINDDEDQEDEFESEVQAKVAAKPKRKGKQSSAATPATISIADLRDRCQAADDKVEALGLEDHRTVKTLIRRLFRSLLSLDKASNSEKTEFAANVVALEEYVDAANAQMGGGEDDGGNDGDDKNASDRAAVALTGPRFDHFHANVLELLTTPQLDSHVPFEQFLDMINSNLPAGMDEISTEEAEAILEHMQQQGEIDWKE